MGVGGSPYMYVHAEIYASMFGLRWCHLVFLCWCYLPLCKLMYKEELSATDYFFRSFLCKLLVTERRNEKY